MLPRLGDLHGCGLTPEVALLRIDYVACLARSSTPRFVLAGITSSVSDPCTHAHVCCSERQDVVDHGRWLPPSFRPCRWEHFGAPAVSSNVRDVPCLYCRLSHLSSNLGTVPESSSLVLPSLSCCLLAFDALRTFFTGVCLSTADYLAQHACTHCCCIAVVSYPAALSSVHSLTCVFVPSRRAAFRWVLVLSGGLFSRVPGVRSACTHPHTCGSRGNVSGGSCRRYLHAVSCLCACVFG